MAGGVPEPRGLGCVCSRSIAGSQHGLPIAVLGAHRSLHSPGLWARPPAFYLCAEGRRLAHGVSLSPSGSIRPLFKLCSCAWATMLASRSKPSSLHLKLSFVLVPLCPQPHVSVFVLTFTCNLLLFRTSAREQGSNRTPGSESIPMARWTVGSHQHS